jgi:hypothetical protein
MSLVSLVGVHIFNGSQHYIIKVRKRIFTVAKPWAQPDKLMREYYWWLYGARAGGFIVGILIVALAQRYLT